MLMGENQLVVEKHYYGSDVDDDDDDVKVFAQKNFPIGKSFHQTIDIYVYIQ